MEIPWENAPNTSGERSLDDFQIFKGENFWKRASFHMFHDFQSQSPQLLMFRGKILTVVGDHQKIAKNCERLRMGMVSEQKRGPKSGKLYSIPWIALQALC